jgi:hypothetical protein
MTDTERVALSERIATLAEAAGLPADLLWKVATKCPQGHKNYHMVYIHGGSSTNWEENKRWRTGDLCPTCIIDGTEGLQLLDLEDAYAIAESKAEEHRAYPDYHPEWRIGRKVKDLTDPANLLAVVEAWRMQKTRRSWALYSQIDWDGGPTVVPLADISNECDEQSEADGETPWEALALAFAEALGVRE